MVRPPTNLWIGFVGTLGIWALSAAPVAAQAPTYASDIAPILGAHCVSCHRAGDIAPFSLETFDDVRQRGRAIAEVTRRRYMPPWKPLEGFGGPFVGERRLTDAQIHTIARWVEGGMPEGPPAESRSNGSAPAEWQLGTPDLVVTLTEPYILTADGPDVFRNFVLPIGVGEQKFVAAVEFSAGASRGIHHANLRFDRTTTSRELDAADTAPGYEGAVSMYARYPDGYFLGWTPGQSPLLSAKSMAWALEPGTDLVAQLHLRKTGKAEEVRPKIAFYFTGDAPTRTPLAVRLGRQNIDIKPGERYLVADSYHLPVDVELHAVHPHAHYRAREIRATADLPDGSRHWLLRIDDWDFNWQDVYRYATPIPLPKGTTITMVYTYDNSEDNPRNPDRPPRRVIFGQNSTDEMGDLWLQVVTRTPDDRAALFADLRPKIVAEDTAGYEMLVAANPNHAGYRGDLALLLAALQRYDEAIEQYEAALRLQPDWAPSHYNLATLLVGMGRLDDAAVHFRRAIALRPGHSESHNNLGAVLVARGQVDEGVEEFRRAVAIDPDNVQARDNLERALAHRRQ
jgi:tetratricopeptide (TPR) repeat protein/mono/diheme cytochrome c family protein